MLKVIAVDDESWALDEITSILSNTEDVETVNGFSNATATIEWAKENPFDVAFLDIDMRGMGGIELAKELRKINKNCFIVFCTGYSDYMPDAFNLHANAYIMKPVMPEKIEEEIKYIRGFGKTDKLLKVRCYGGFEVTDMDNVPLYFNRRKTKELFALLFSKNGMPISSRDICACLWEDDGENDRKNLDYFYKLHADLTKALKSIKADRVLVKNGVEHFLNPQMIEVVGSPDDGEFLQGYNWYI